MRISLYLAAAVVLATPAFAQTIPPQQKNNDASVGGAITTKPPQASPVPERRDDTVDTLGRNAPPSDGAGTTTGSALPGERAVDREIDAQSGNNQSGGIQPGMDDDKAEIDRNRAPRERR